MSLARGFSAETWRKRSMTSPVNNRIRKTFSRKIEISRSSPRLVSAKRPPTRTLAAVDGRVAGAAGDAFFLAIQSSTFAGRFRMQRLGGTPRNASPAARLVSWFPRRDNGGGMSSYDLHQRMVAAFLTSQLQNIWRTINPWVNYVYWPSSCVH